MHRFIHRHILLPGFESLIKRRNTLGYLKDLESSQWLGRAELERRQLDSLRVLLRYAVANCPYYRDVWRERGLDPSKIQSLTDFRDWPVIDRSTISANRAQMRTQSPDQRVISKSTGGSSGEPLKFELNLDSNDRRSAASHRGYEWAGAGLGAKLLYLWGVALGRQSRLKQWKESLYHGLYRRKMLNSFDLTEDRVPVFLAEHNRYRPDVVVAYTNPLYEFARMLKERNLKPFSPKSLIVGAEKLHDFQRQLIEEVFQAPVFETYGSREFMLMAAECDRHEGLHLTFEHLLLEVLDDEGNPTPDGQEGNVAVTDLFNYGMPFIRYLNGDRAIAGWSTCSCGRGLPLMKPVLGRTLDVLHTPDGRRVPGEFFPHLMKDFAVKRFQVVQDEPDHIELRMIVAPGWQESDRVGIEHEIRGVLGPSVRFDMVKVNEIPLTGAGKLRVVLNLCGGGQPRQHSTIHG